jgi:hypothetical protein
MSGWKVKKGVKCEFERFLVAQDVCCSSSYKSVTYLFTDSFFSLITFVKSASDNVTAYRMDPSGCPQMSGGLKLHLQIPFKLYPLQGVVPK